ncbi:MAG: hypothetical protein WBW94_11645 [Anaerolineales bacterium]
MSKNNKNKRIIAIAVLLIFTSILCGVIYIVYISSDPFIEERRYPDCLTCYHDMGGYEINPETILESLNRGETNVFMPELATPEAPIYEGSLAWHQSDYLKIAGALDQFVWKDNLKDWSLYGVDFYADCQNNPNGFTLGDFIFFKSVFYDGEITYTAREIQITPQYRDVAWGGGTAFPRPILGWDSVNLSNFKFNADDALLIAEENGGKEARVSVQNMCRVIVGISGYTGWEVYYDGNNGSPSFLFKIQIDPYTGKAIK